MALPPPWPSRRALWSSCHRAHVHAAARHEPRIAFLAAPLTRMDGELTVHAPRVTGYISHSATDLHGTAPAFTAPARSVGPRVQLDGD